MPAETVDCSPAALIEAASCYKCIPNGLQIPVILYLLDSLGADGRLGPAELMNRAACYKCIPPGMQAEVQTYLLCGTLSDVIMNSKLLDTGIAQLAGGTATVNSASADAGNVILLTMYGSGNPASYSNIIAGVSFDINSSSSQDNNLVSWAILKP